MDVERHLEAFDVRRPAEVVDADLGLANADVLCNIDLPAKAKGKTVIRKSGTIPFTCKYHPGMRGVLKVAAN